MTTSAYPLPVDELTDRVREHAQDLGAWPSLRTVMAEFRVGRPKATAALAALRTTGFDPTPTTSTGADTAPLPALHVVPNTDTPDQDDTDSGHDTEESSARGKKGTATTPAEAALVAMDDAPADELTPVPSGSPDAAPPPLTVGVDAPAKRSRFGSWPLVLIALGAFVSIWGGWVGLGELTGFGPIRLLPGIVDAFVINSAITLPIGVEAYAAFALRTWLAPAGAVSDRARTFARWSAIGALALGAAGQIAYHLMVAAGITHAPWPITAFVACLPVVVLGCGAALTHLVHRPAVDREDA